MKGCASQTGDQERLKKKDALSGGHLLVAECWVQFPVVRTLRTLNGADQDVYTNSL